MIAKTQMTSKKYIVSFISACLLLLAFSTAVAVAPGDIQYERKMHSDAGDMDSELESFPPAVFPHWIHRINYRCDVCHDSIFEMKRGGTLVTMDLMAQGKVCGTCHNKVLAFGSDFQSCERCHIVSEE